MQYYYDIVQIFVFGTIFLDIITEIVIFNNFFAFLVGTPLDCMESDLETFYIYDAGGIMWRQAAGLIL